ncbi:MAG: hypothetical protein ACRENS_05005, partial [Candidatus Eiseniibacteriota bacterium]
MHFLDAWTRLAPAELARLILAPASLALAIVLPGRRRSAIACLGLAIAALIMPGDESLIHRLAWTLLWLLLASSILRASPDPPADPTVRHGGVESGAVALLLGFALMLLLIAAVARQNLEEAPTRDSSYALFLVALGLLHLMLRRHVLRASVAIGAMGLGLDRLNLAAEAQQLPGAAMPALAVW